MPMLPVPEAVFRVTDLARRSYDVVAQALRAPVKIKSPYGHVAVLAHARFSNTYRRVLLVEDLMRARCAAEAAMPAAAFPRGLRWMRFLSAGERAALCNEVLAVLATIEPGGSIVRVDDALRRWSCVAARHGLTTLGTVKYDNSGHG